MPRAPEQLPEFDAPPVVEVALAVAFEPLELLSNVKLVEVWFEIFRDRFPNAEEKPPYGVPIEGFGGRMPPMVRMSTGLGPPPARYWMISERGNELVQLQHDWFARNWRKSQEDELYPRYEVHIRPAFAAHLGEFVQSVEAADLGKVVPTQCEVTYINHITPSGFWEAHRDAARVFRQVREISGFPGSAESFGFRSDHIISDPSISQRPLGRLHVRVDSAVSQPAGEPLFQLTLTARGAPLGGGLDGVLDFLDLGRKWVVGSFVSMTTDDAHSAWRRTQ